MQADLAPTSELLPLEPIFLYCLLLLLVFYVSECNLQTAGAFQVKTHTQRIEAETSRRRLQKETHREREKNNAPNEAANRVRLSALCAD